MPSVKADESVVSIRAFNALRALIASETGIVLNTSKRNFLAARLQSRLRALGMDSYDRYCEHAQKHQREIEYLVNAVTTNKTSFFREDHHFKVLAEDVVPRLVARAARTGVKNVRIWSAGCSSGQEAYSIAMVLDRTLPDPTSWDIKILASDIDTDVLAAGERGVYADEVADELMPEMRRAYMTRTADGKLEVIPRLRSLVKFRRMNLNASTWPIQTQFDVVFCRNVVIYFDQQTQRRLFTRFAHMLRPDGLLVLGHSETLHWMPERYKNVAPTVYALVQPADPDYRPLGSRVDARALGPELQKARHITVGQVFATAKPTSIRTLLGSCVAACLYDPIARVGGMNHFLLPAGRDDEPTSARFGVHAMELLINAIMRQGGDRRRIEAKIFGGAHVVGGLPNSVAEKNIAFIREFLATEKIYCRSELLGGEEPFDVWMFTATGRVLVRRLSANVGVEVAKAESTFANLHGAAVQRDPDAVTLF